MAGSLGTAILELTATNAALVAKLDESKALTEANMAETGGIVSEHAKLIGAAIAGAFAVDKIVEFGKSSVEAAMGFQHAMELVHTQAGASQAAVDQLSAGILHMAASVGTAPETLAEGMFHLASQGLKGAQAMDALKVAAEGAKVGGANLEDVTNALGAALVSGIKGTSNMSAAMGTLNAIVGAGDMRMQDLADAMGTGLATKAKIFGLTLDDVGAALAVFGDNNIRGAKAATDLGSAIRLMGAESPKAATALATVGLTSTQLADDMRSSGGLVSAIQDLRTHMEAAGLSASEQARLLTEAFGGKQATGVMILVDQIDRLKTKEQEVADGSKAFGDAWAATTQTAQFNADKFHAALDVLKITLGDELLPAVTAAAAALADFMGWLVNGESSAQHFADVLGAVGVSAGAQAAIIDGIKTAVQDLQTAFDAVTPVAIDAAKTAFDGLKTAATAVFDAIQSHQTLFEMLGAAVGGAAIAIVAMRVAMAAATVVTEGLAAAQAALDVVMAANPFVLAVIAIGALVGALVVAYEKVGWFHDFVNTAFHDIQAVISAVVSAVTGIWNRWGDDIKSVASAVWGFVSGLVADNMHAIQGVIEVVTGLIHGDWGKAWDGIKEILSAAWDAMKAVVTSQIDVIVALVKAIGPKIIAVFSDAASWLVDAGTAIVEGLVKGIESKVGDAISTAESLASKVKDAALGFLGIHSPSQVFVEIGQQIVAGLQVGIDMKAKDAAAQMAKVAATVKTAMTDAQPEIEAAAKALGENAVQGIVGGVLGVQKTAGEQIKAALVTAMAPKMAEAANSAEIDAATKALGGAAVQKILDAVEGKAPSMAEQMKTALAAAMAPRIAETADSAQIAAASQLLGATAVQKIIDGAVGKTPTMAQQLSQALTAATQAAEQQTAQNITAATSTFTQAFSQLASSAVQAFNTGMAGWVSPAQTILNRMQLADQTKQYADAVKNSLAAIDADKKAILAAQAAGDLTAQQAAEKQLESDQATHDAAVRAQTEFGLSQDAATQAAHHAAEEKAQAASLATLLGQLQGSLPQQLAEWAKTHADVLADGSKFDADSFLQHDTYLSGLLDKVKTALAAHPALWKSTYGDILDAVKGYAGQLQNAGASNADAHKTGVAGKHDDIVGEWTSILNGSYDAVAAFESQFFAAGQSIGNQLAAGLESVAEKAAAAAGKIASDISAFFPHSPAKRGPLMRLPDWTAWVTGGLTPGLADGHAARVAAGVASSATSGAGGGITIPVYLDGKKIAESTRKHLTLAGGRNGIQIVGPA